MPGNDLVRQAQKKSQAELECLLLECLQSGLSTPMTRKDWDAIGREVQKRVACRQRG